jgi:hypothetical protein
VHSLRAKQIFMWAKDLPSYSPFKTRLRCLFKTPMPDLRQALQRADIVVKGHPTSALETKHFLKTKPCTHFYEL